MKPKSRVSSPVPEPEWPADQVERRPLAALIPYARNARMHSEAQVTQLAASIREWGWTVPVLVDEDGTLIAGHGRVLAGQKLGLETVPVTVARGWSEAKVKAYRIADNKLSLNADWDPTLLALEMAELRDIGIAVDLTGFSLVEIDSMLAPDSDPRREWQGMPDYEQDAAKAFRSITVHFDDAEAVADFARLLGVSFTDKTKSIWHPPHAPEPTLGMAYVAEAPAAAE